MATRHMIAIKRSNAIDRLDAGLAIIAAETGVKMPDMPRAGKVKQNEMLQARQLEAFAETIWLIVGALGWTPPEPEVVETPPAEGDTLDTMTRDELVALALEWDIPFNEDDEDTLIAQAIRDSGLLITQPAEPTEPPPAGKMLDALISPPEAAKVRSANEIMGEVVSTYDDLTLAELRELAAKRDIDLTGAKLKADVIERLLLADIAAASDE